MIYSCTFLLLLSCKVKSGKEEVSQSSFVEQTTHENISEEVPAVISEPLFMEAYKRSDWFEHYKGGKRHGEELRWYENGHLWQRNHYVDDEEAFPRESWYYNAAESDYAYSSYSQEAPDRYEYTYQASEGSSPYYIEETYALENGKKKHSLLRRYLANDLNKKISFPEFQCDSVRRDVVTIGSQKRLEIRIFDKGHLRRFESYVEPHL